MNHYIDKHSGVKYSQKEIDENTRKAKVKYREIQIMDFDSGVNFCEECYRLHQEEGFIPPKTMEYKIIDVSHEKSVQQCKNEGLIEKVWDFRNFKLLCRKHHDEHHDSEKSLHFSED